MLKKAVMPAPHGWFGQAPSLLTPRTPEHHGIHRGLRRPQRLADQTAQREAISVDGSV